MTLKLYSISLCDLDGSPLMKGPTLVEPAENRVLDPKTN